MKEEAKKVGGKGSNILSGRALFKYDPNLFQDDEAAADGDVYEERNEDEEEEKKEEDGNIEGDDKEERKEESDGEDNYNSDANVDEALFQQEAPGEGGEEEEPDFD